MNTYLWWRRCAPAVGLCAGFIGFGGAATVASAQDEAADAQSDEESVSFETFEVTGSRIKRSDYETAQPVMVIDREEIDKTGLVSIGELISDLPQAGASLGRAFNNGGDGSVEIDLRNLGSNRVLVLVDGRRWIPGTRVLGGGGVDLSTIPVSIVERIEILQDGASAVYGSDAVAGVVNIITRKDFQGFEARSQYGQYIDGDGEELATSFAVGQVSDTTSVFFDVSYREIMPVFAGDREISAVPTFGVPNTSRGSLFTPEGSFLFVPDPSLQPSFEAGQPVDPCFQLASADSVALGAAFGALPSEAAPLAGPLAGAAGMLPMSPESPAPAASGVDLCFFRFAPGTGGGAFPDYSAFNFNTDAFNFAPLNYLETPQERSSIFTQMQHRLSDSITIGSKVLYNVRESQQILANNPLIMGDLFPAPFNIGFADDQQEFNPFGQDIGMGDPAAGLVGLGAVGRRLLEAGPRNFQQKNETFRFGIDLKGDFFAFDNFMSWDVGYIYSDSETRVRESGLQNLQRVAFALGPPENCDRAADTGNAADDSDIDGPCVPLDLFNGFDQTTGTGTITDEMLEYVSYVAQDVDRNTQRILYAGFSSEISQTAAFLPAPVGIAVGLEQRTDTIDTQPDPLKINGTSSTNLESATKGETDVIEGFVEVGIPLLQDLPFVQDLSLTLALRRSEYTIPGATEDFLQTVPNPDPVDAMMNPTIDVLATREFEAEFNNTSGKLGLEYRPTTGLLLRGGYSDSFRAPSVSELFLGRLQSFPSVADPCSDYTNANRDDEDNIDNIRQNCANDGVPAGYTQSGSQITTVFGGNPRLDPETADSYSLGFVMTPADVFNIDALEGIELLVDVFRYELRDFITVPGAGAVLGLCYAANPDQRSLCEFVNRTDGGQIANLQTVFTNFAEVNTDGVDIDFVYNIPFFRDFGKFKFTTSASYTHSYEQVTDTPNGPQSAEFVGFTFGVATLPRWRVNTSLTWESGPWSAVWNTRFIDRTFAICNDGLQALSALNSEEEVQSLEEFGLCSHPGDNPIPGGATSALQELERTIYNDFQLGYQFNLFGAGSQLTVGVRNAFDQDPPVNYTALANSYNVATYDTPGVRPYLRFQAEF